MRADLSIRGYTFLLLTIIYSKHRYNHIGTQMYLRSVSSERIEYRWLCRLVAPLLKNKLSLSCYMPKGSTKEVLILNINESICKISAELISITPSLSFNFQSQLSKISIKGLRLTSARVIRLIHLPHVRSWTTKGKRRNWNNRSPTPIPISTQSTTQSQSILYLL